MTVQTFPTLAASNASLPEVERFLAPISEERPAGEWLRFDPLYDEVRRMREEDDASLPQGVWQRELKRADWEGVARLCETALETRTKDLQIGAWMTEAWIRVYGFRGFERGIQVLDALCRTFWEELYPAFEDGSVEARVAPIAWASERLVLPLKSIPLTAPAGEQAVAFAWRDWEAALYLANQTKTPGAQAAPVPERAVTQAKFLVSVSLTPAARFVALEADLKAANAALDALDQTLTERLGPLEAPSLMSLRTALTAMQNYVGRVRAERGERGELPAPMPLDEPLGQEVAMTTEPMSSGGAIASRAEAYQRLREASEYLMRTEPHSPVPYLVRRAISWGNLSLAELLEELLQKNADLPTINALLGIRKT